VTALLASVRDRREAAQALAAGIDLLDVKDPATGALGAPAPVVVADIVALAAGRVPVSATTGDEPPDSTPVRRRVAALAGTGCTIVKVAATAPIPRLQAAFAGLGRLTAPGQALVAVLPLEAGLSPARLAALAASGIAAVVIDTMDKRAGPLALRAGTGTLARFIAWARGAGLGCGLAGGLRRADIAPLLALGPDILGFRGALCAADRRGALDPGRLAAVRAAIPRGGAAATNPDIEAGGHAA